MDKQYLNFFSEVQVTVITSK